MLAALLAAGMGYAGPTNATPASVQQELDSATVRRLAERAVVLKERKVNQATVGKVQCSGVAVAVVRADNPLQLLNPAAPARYGTLEDSIVREPMSRKAVGIKLFSIDF